MPLIPPRTFYKTSLFCGFLFFFWPASPFIFIVPPHLWDIQRRRAVLKHEGQARIKMRGFSFPANSSSSLNVIWHKMVLSWDRFIQLYSRFLFNLIMPKLTKHKKQVMNHFLCQIDTGRPSKRVRISWLWHYIHYLSISAIPLWTSSRSEPFSRHTL